MENIELKNVLTEEEIEVKFQDLRKSNWELNKLCVDCKQPKFKDFYFAENTQPALKKDLLKRMNVVENYPTIFQAV